MRTTITIADALAEQVRRRAEGVTLSVFARLALQERVERLEREELARAMAGGYAAEAAASSLHKSWGSTELEGWE
jgi:hypothetical protein